jgi:hypothetical protein
MTLWVGFCPKPKKLGLPETNCRGKNTLAFCNPVVDEEEELYNIDHQCLLKTTFLIYTDAE